MSISSENIFVFPCVSRSKDYELKAKLMSEENITNIIKSITDSPSYIIDYDKNTKILEFVIDGYYFKLTEFTPSGTQYAVLKYKADTPKEIKIIDGDNTNNQFNGLTIETSQPKSGTYLLISENNEIPDRSKIKFSRESLNMSSIDCGELNNL